MVVPLVGRFSRNLEWEWLGKLGWLETVTPWVVNWVNRLGTSPIKVDWVGVVDFQLSSGFDMTGFYWDLGWVHQRRVKPPGQPILEVLEGVDNLGQDETGGFCWEIGVNGLVGRHWSGVGRWLNEWVGVRGGF